MRGSLEAGLKPSEKRVHGKSTVDDDTGLERLRPTELSVGGLTRLFRTPAAKDESNQDEK